MRYAYICIDLYYTTYILLCLNSFRYFVVLDIRVSHKYLQRKESDFSDETPQFYPHHHHRTITSIFFFPIFATWFSLYIYVVCPIQLIFVLSARWCRVYLKHSLSDNTSPGANQAPYWDRIPSGKRESRHQEGISIYTFHCTLCAV